MVVIASILLDVGVRFVVWYIRYYRAMIHKQMNVKKNVRPKTPSQIHNYKNLCAGDC